MVKKRSLDRVGLVTLVALVNRVGIRADVVLLGGLLLLLAGAVLLVLLEL